MKTYAHIISRWILLRMRNVPDKHCRETQNTHFIFNNFFPKVVPFIDNVEKYDRTRRATDENIIWRMRIACWITKATDTHWEYAIVIAFLRQQWLREGASVLSYTYIVCLVQYWLRFFSGILFNVLCIIFQIVLIICCFATYIINKIKSYYAAGMIYFPVSDCPLKLLTSYNSEKPYPRLSVCEPQILSGISGKSSTINNPPDLVFGARSYICQLSVY
jgi:hypothetical protein